MTRRDNDATFAQRPYDLYAGKYCITVGSLHYILLLLANRLIGLIDTSMLILWPVVTTIQLLPVRHRISMEETIARSSALSTTHASVG